MGEPKGPEGLPESTEPGKNLVRRADEEVAETLDQAARFKENAEFFSKRLAEICAVDLDKNLTPEVIRDYIIQSGFPNGLAITLGVTFLECIADARQTLSVAAKKPALRDSLISSVRDEIIKYFIANKETIEIAIFASQNPIANLNASVNILSTNDFDIHIKRLPTVDQIKTLHESITMLSGQGVQRLLEGTARTVVQAIIDKFGKKITIEELSDKYEEGGLHIPFRFSSPYTEEDQKQIEAYVESMFPYLSIGPRLARTDPNWNIRFKFKISIDPSYKIDKL